MKTKNTKNTNDEAGDAPELSPQQSQQLADGPDHGHRLHSREEVIRRHGAEVIHANEEAADVARQTRGHAQRLRKDHGR